MPDFDAVRATRLYGEDVKISLGYTYTDNVRGSDSQSNLTAIGNQDRSNRRVLSIVSRSYGGCIPSRMVTISDGRRSVQVTTQMVRAAKSWTDRHLHILERYSNDSRTSDIGNTEVDIITFAEIDRRGDLVEVRVKITRSRSRCGSTLPRLSVS